MLSQAIQFLVRGSEERLGKEVMGGSVVTVHVDEIASKIAKFYEQIRNVVDYREEHLLRKNSIFRSLQRSLLLYGKKDAIAESLIKEIIRSGHLTNDAIPEEKIAEVDHLIANLQHLHEWTKQHPPKERAVLSQWLMRLTASAIEEHLDPPVKDELIADTMFLALKDHLVIKGKDISESDKVFQLFIGIQRALLRVDEDQLSWRLVRFMYPHWQNPTSEELQEIGSQLANIKKAVDAHMAHGLGGVFFALCNRYNTVFLLLGDAVFARQETPGNLQGFLQNVESLTASVKEAYTKRYEQQKKRLRRLAFFSIISLFITKVVVALAIEIPIDTYITHDYSLLNTAINILFPPLLMLVIIAFIRLPSDANIALILQEVRAVVYASHQKEYLLVIAKEKSQIIHWAVRIFYLIISGAVFYGLLVLLSRIHFSVASTAVFILFTSIIAATGVRVRNRSKEISLEEDRSTFISFLGDLLFMPFVTIGKATIAGLGRFRFLVILVNLIDAPFQVFVSFVENFNSFIRSKKEELH